MPPFDLVLDKAIFAMLIPLLVAAAVFFVTSRFVPRCGDLVGGVLALVAGFLAGNFRFGAVEFAFGENDTFPLVEFFQGMSRSFLAPVEGEPRGLLPRYCLPWTILVASLVGLVARLPKMPLAIGWLLRSAAAVLAARLLVDSSLRADIPWLWPAFAVTVLAIWAVVESLARESHGGAVPLALGMVFMAASVVTIHAHSVRMTDIASLFAAACLGVAFAAWFRKADASAVAPFAAVALPGVMLVCHETTFSKVPLTSYFLIALAPIALAPLLVLRAKETRGKVLVFVGAGLLLIPVVIAVVLTVLAESIALE